MLARSLIIKTSAIKPVEKLVRKSFLFKPLVRRFIAGDTLDEAISASEALVAKGFFVTLDYLGENTKSEAEALEAKATYNRMLERIALSKCHTPPKEVKLKEGEILEATNISIKLTQCGLDQGVEFAEKNYHDVLETAARNGNFVRVDMEASAYTERTIEIMKRTLPEHKNTGTVLQSYLLRTSADVDLMIELQARTRLVKGAYLEPPAVAHKDKAHVDAAYVELAKRLVEKAYYPAIATHDEKIIKQINAFVAEKGIDRSRFEYQMLFGIRRDLQDSLMKDGYNVRVYVPFGESWYPYFTRRLAERPANAFFILRSLFKG